MSKDKTTEIAGSGNKSGVVGVNCECYNWIKGEIQIIIDYPTEKQGRRTEDGYPSEIIYDEFAFKRMVDSYREGLKGLLKAFESKINEKKVTSVNYETDDSI